MGLDIGPASREIFRQAIQRSNILVWNGCVNPPLSFYWERTRERENAKMREGEGETQSKGSDHMRVANGIVWHLGNISLSFFPLVVLQAHGGV
jgi:hypothetical protein